MYAKVGAFNGETSDRTSKLTRRFQVKRNVFITAVNDLT
jgi:hypothetical protein